MQIFTSVLLLLVFICELVTAECTGSTSQEVCLEEGQLYVVPPPPYVNTACGSDPLYRCCPHKTVPEGGSILADSPAGMKCNKTP
ncbi:hypothetical protein Pst134EA_024276 [Puccinia striiformis f. sp. tritici]|uniref:uncharacterized protein n=1 Tax=Puccinia striiformis f. sp. tritici TaxID=168172 RepID=UPI00200720A0|nr:uncharacterized protein Pst134EA_032034 [Puccinia striiformis f. sp. tritici]XP_047800608.1 hypothetical protein Pst134EA_024276 [Puccinia striiformis f. sp. tritici]KAI9606731.1 hypothetical protein H4Q26_006268 [Puccinia striiformis f. sp. tritici PST-130]KAH9444370.1 hypothetical protein Pst134EA_032034 [Puccinia striiformis f. sp. tritici]KAH9444709.1 hypothetical protein Pst134EB_024965 [Puccinia striiformis f. sp. tritici]KAH9453400.1 hypothetical protein Pst134EA_024276 [Puccinia str